MNNVNVKPLGARVTGDYRRLRDQIPSWRPLKPYRLNLVQLSQEHNLIFVARGSQIHVSEPSFPGQGLPLTAPLVLDGQRQVADLVIRPPRRPLTKPVTLRRGSLSNNVGK